MSISELQSLNGHASEIVISVGQVPRIVIGTAHSRPVPRRYGMCKPILRYLSANRGADSRFGKDSYKAVPLGLAYRQ